MKVRLLGPPAIDGVPYLTSFLINDQIAVDAGCLAYWGDPEGQEAVGHVFLSHSHADHIASLPIFIDNIAGAKDLPPLKIYGNAAVLDCLRQDMFNDRIWPDLTRFQRDNGEDYYELIEIADEVPIQVAGLTLTPVTVDHLVPTLSYIIEDENAALGLIADTGPTMRIWEILAQKEKLAAVFLEASFPDRMASMAALSFHLTPSLFAAELDKLGRPIKSLAYHIKARYRDEVVRELLNLGRSELEIAVADREYEF